MKMPADGKRKTILPGPRRGCVTVPSSKSIAHRELIAAVLSGVEEPKIRGQKCHFCLAGVFCDTFVTKI